MYCTFIIMSRGLGVVGWDRRPHRFTDVYRRRSGPHYPGYPVTKATLRDLLRPVGNQDQDSTDMEQVDLQCLSKIIPLTNVFIGAGERRPADTL